MFARPSETFVLVPRFEPRVARLPAEVASRLPGCQVATIRIPEGTNANFNRRNCTGHMAGSDGDYPETRRMGHTPVALIHEITSGFQPEGVTFLRELAQQHLDIKIPACFEGQSWTACTFTAYFAQRISLAVRRKVSEQLKTVCTRWTRKRPPRATRAPLQPVPGG